MKHFILICVASAIVFFLLTGMGAGQESTSLRTFMRAKLKHSEKILEGLALEDYDAMAKGSQELSLLSLAATWQVFQTPEYDKQSQEFRRAADALTKAAKNKNLDEAAAAYGKMTVSCVNCHKYVRRTRMAARFPHPREPQLLSDQSFSKPMIPN